MYKKYLSIDHILGIYCNMLSFNPSFEYFFDFYRRCTPYKPEFFFSERLNYFVDKSYILWEDIFIKVYSHYEDKGYDLQLYCLYVWKFFRHYIYTFFYQCRFFWFVLYCVCMFSFLKKKPSIYKWFRWFFNSKFFRKFYTLTSMNLFIFIISLFTLLVSLNMLFIFNNVCDFYFFKDKIWKNWDRLFFSLLHSPYFFILPLNFLLLFVPLSIPFNFFLLHCLINHLFYKFRLKVSKTNCFYLRFLPNFILFCLNPIVVFLNTDNWSFLLLLKKRKFLEYYLDICTDVSYIFTIIFSKELVFKFIFFFTAFSVTHVWFFNTFSIFSQKLISTPNFSNIWLERTIDRYVYYVTAKQRFIFKKILQFFNFNSVYGIFWYPSRAYTRSFQSFTTDMFTVKYARRRYRLKLHKIKKGWPRTKWYVSYWIWWRASETRRIRKYLLRKFRRDYKYRRKMYYLRFSDGSRRYIDINSPHIRFSFSFWFFKWKKPWKWGFLPTSMNGLYMMDYTGARIREPTYSYVRLLYWGKDTPTHHIFMINNFNSILSKNKNLRIVNWTINNLDPFRWSKPLTMGMEHMEFKFYPERYKLIEEKKLTLLPYEQTPNKIHLSKLLESRKYMIRPIEGWGFRRLDLFYQDSSYWIHAIDWSFEYRNRFTWPSHTSDYVRRYKSFNFYLIPDYISQLYSITNPIRKFFFKNMNFSYTFLENIFNLKVYFNLNSIKRNYFWTFKRYHLKRHDNPHENASPQKVLYFYINPVKFKFFFKEYFYKIKLYKFDCDVKFNFFFEKFRSLLSFILNKFF